MACVASLVLLARLDDELRGARAENEPTDGAGDAGGERHGNATGWSAWTSEPKSDDDEESEGGYVECHSPEARDSSAVRTNAGRVRGKEVRRSSGERRHGMTTEGYGGSSSGDEEDRTSLRATHMAKFVVH